MIFAAPLVPRKTPYLCANINGRNFAPSLGSTLGARRPPPPPLNSISGGYTVKWWWGMWPGCLGMLPFQLFYESPSFPDLLRSPSQNFDSLIKVLTCFAGDSQGIFLDTFWWKRQNWTSRMFLNQFFVNICGVWRVLDKLIFLSIIFEKYRWTRPTRRKVAQKSIKS